MVCNQVMVIGLLTGRALDWLPAGFDSQAFGTFLPYRGLPKDYLLVAITYSIFTLITKTYNMQVI